MTGHRGRRGWGGGFPGGGPGRGPRARRGDVRAAILALLAEEPRNGYQIMQEIEERSDGVWRPSPGSVYPALSQLEDEGLVEQVSGEGESRRKFRLTEEGTSYVESHQEELKAPWEAMSGSVRGGMFELRDLLGQTAFAAIQVARAGTDAQVAAAKTLLDDTRRGLYRILADGDITPNDSGEDETGEDETE